MSGTGRECDSLFKVICQRVLLSLRLSHKSPGRSANYRIASHDNSQYLRLRSGVNPATVISCRWYLHFNYTVQNEKLLLLMNSQIRQEIQWEFSEILNGSVSQFFFHFPQFLRRFMINFPRSNHSTAVQYKFKHF